MISYLTLPASSSPLSATPIEAGYSQHYGDKKRSLSDVPKEGNHPKMCMAGEEANKWTEESK